MTVSVRATRILASLLLAGCLFLSSLQAFAAVDPEFVGVLALMSDPAVAKDLGLTDDVKKQLADIVAKREDEAIQFALEIKDLPAMERKDKLAPFVAESEKLGLALLTDDQKTKLQQIRVSKLGMKGLLEDSIATQVGLTDKQRTLITNAYAFNEMKTAGLPEAERVAANMKVERDVLAMLDKDQRAKWEAMGGKGEVALAPGEEPAEKPTADKPEAGKPGNATPPARTIVPGKPAANMAVKAAKAPLKAGDPNVKLKFQFQATPWKDVIEWFAEQAGYSLVTDAYPPGTFSYIDTRSYTPAQGITLLNKVLILRGFRLVRHDQMLFLLSADDELPAEFYSRITDADLDTLGEFDIVQCQFQLSKITAEEAEIEVRKLISPHGKVVILPKAKQIIVTETVGALKQVRNALKAIENPEIAKDEDLTIVKMEHLRPSEFMLLARQLLGIPDNLYATPDGSLRIAMDELGMRLLVTGKAEKVAKLQEIQKLIDVESSPSGDDTVLETPQLIIYSVENADPLSVLQILQTLLAGIADVRLTIDPKSGNLVAFCRPAQHATIKATLAELQRDATQYKTFKLRKNDPQSITLQINELFGGSADKPSANAPKVVADTTNLQLLVRASPAQLAKIQELLKEMGELGGTASAQEATARSTMRVLPASGRTLENVLSQLEYSWPAQGNVNKIKVHRIQRNVPGQLQDNLNPGTSSDGPGARRQESPEERQFREENGISPAEAERLRQGPIPAPPATAPAAPPTTGAPPAAAPATEKAPAPAKPAPLDPKRTTNNSYWFQFTSYQAPEGASDEQAEPAEPAPPAGPKSKPGADIVITIASGSIIIASEDLDALDKFEAELRLLIEAAGGNNTKDMNVIPLRYVKAQVAATLVTEILNGAPAQAEGGGGGGSLMGDLAAGMMGDMFGGLLGGMGGGGGAGAATSGGLSIIPDIRNNQLFVNCTQRDLDRIDQILLRIDIPSPPDGIQINPAPRFIPIENTTAESVSVVVRSVYAGRLTAEGGGGQQRQPNPAELIQALRGGRGGGQQQQNKGEEQKMTVGVDNRTNSLVVVAPDYLFEEVKALVKTLDVAELASDTVIKIHTLKGANADVLTRSLGQLYGDALTISKTGATGTTAAPRTGAAGAGARPAGGNQQRPGGQRTNQAPPQPQIDPAVRQQMDMFNALQGGGRGGRGGGGGGGFGGGGRGGR